MDMDDRTPAVPVQAVLNPNARLETAELGCVAVAASTETDASTSMIPARPAPTRVKGLDGKRENHHDDRTRGIPSFLCDPDSDLSPATPLNAADGAVRVAPDLHLASLWIAMAIPEPRVAAKAKAGVSQRARMGKPKAQSERHLTVKLGNRRANSIATASALVGTRANTGMPMTAAT